MPGLRLFTFGVGYDVNTALLDKLAAENGGVADYVEPKEDLEVKVSNFFSKVNYPVLTDLKLDMAGVQTDLVYPQNASGCIPRLASYADRPLPQPNRHGFCQVAVERQVPTGRTRTFFTTIFASRCAKMQTISCRVCGRRAASVG